MRVLPCVHAARRARNAKQRRVIALRHVVELVIVAARARDRRAKKRLAEHLDLVVDALGLVEPRVDRRVRSLHHPPPARRDLRLVAARVRIDARLDQVPRHLLHHEAVVRQVGVQRPHDPVAPAPSLANRVVELVAARLRVTHHVEPVTRPVLRMRTIREHLINDALALKRVVSLENAGEPLFAWRQPAQREARAPQPRRAIAIPGRLDAFALERSLHEAIARAPRPTRARRDRDFLELRPRPVALVHGTGFDPAPQHVDLTRRERLVPLRRRHALVRVVAEHALQERAALGIPRHHRRIESLLRTQRILAPVEPQPRLARLRIGSMAREAARREDRRDLARPRRRCALFTRGPRCADDEPKSRHQRPEPPVAHALSLPTPPADRRAPLDTSSACIPASSAARVAHPRYPARHPIQFDGVSS